MSPSEAYDLVDCPFEHFFGQVQQQLQTRERIESALREANAVFAAQSTKPDGYKFMEACNQLAELLDLRIPLIQTEQQALVQTLQIASAMHENAVNNTKLTDLQRSDHYLASTSLQRLCEKATEDSITHTELWCEAFALKCKADEAFANAVHALGLYKYLDTTNDILDTTDPVASLSPAAPRGSGLRPSVHDITDVGQTPRSAALRERALVVSSDRPSKAAPLGRAHTLPTLSKSRPMFDSRSSRTARAPSKAYTGRNGIEALEEEE